MEHIREIIKNKKHSNNVNNDSNNNNGSNVNNGRYKKKYALDKSKFTPNTEKTILAEKVATSLNDLQNYACYLYVVNKIGVADADRLLRSTLSDIEEKKNTKTPVRNKAKYFMYKFRFKKY